MLREKNEMFQGIHRVWDVCLTAAAFIAAYYIKKYLLPDPLAGLSTEPNYYLLLFLCIIIWYSVFAFSGVYRPYRKRAFAWIAIDVAKSVAISLLVLVVVLFFLKQQAVSRIFIGIFIVLDLLLLIGSKWILYRVLAYIRKKGYNFRNVLIVGCGKKARDLAGRIANRSEIGYRVLGCLSTKEAGYAPDAAKSLPVLGNIRDIQDVLTVHVVDELIIVDPLRKIPDIARFIYEAEQMGVSVHIMPEWGLSRIGFEPRIGNLRFETVFGQPALTLTTTPYHQSEIYLKNLFDVVLSLFGLVLCALPFLVIAVAVKLSSKGPVFFRQERVGKNGRRFVLYKFRTMVDDAYQMQESLLASNESDGPVFKIRKDPRVVPFVGTFLRKTSLDELPQLINVLKGEMSIVGPRPPLPEEIKEYDIIQRRRLSMKPGITCIWQSSSSRNDVCFNDWVNMDLEYIDNWSLGLDFRILWKTIGVLLRGEGR